MKRLVKPLFALILIVSVLSSVTSCATTGKYNKVCESWLNHNINELTDRWGYPAQSFLAPNGNKVYVYLKTDSTYIAPYTTPSTTTYTQYGNTVYSQTSGGQTYGGYTLNFYCKTYFETDDVGTIIKYRFEGNICRAK